MLILGASGGIGGLRSLSWEAQLVAFLSGAVIKPAYMLLCLMLIVWLWRTQLPGLRLLRLGLSFFLGGEVLCALEFYCGQPGPFKPLEWLHGVGMVAGAAFGLLALWALLTERIAGGSRVQGPCSLRPFCGGCTRQAPEGCRPLWLLRRCVPLLAVLCLLPYAVDLTVPRFSTDVFGTAVHYGRAPVNQWLEYRLYPVVGAALCGFSWLAFGIRADRWQRAGRALLSWGLGVGLFAVLRVLLMASFRQEPYYADFWEELMELAVVIFCTLALWAFRKPLGLPPTSRL